MSSKSLAIGLATDIREGRGGFDSDLIRKAFLFAESEFKTKPKIAREEIEHSARVAKKLFKYGFDNATIAAGMVHDLEQEVGTEPEKIAAELGKEIESIVTDYTKIKKIERENFGKISNQTLSSIILAMARDLRTIFVKIAAGFDKVQNPKNLDKRKQRINAEAALNIYAPICQKLGLYELQGLLEDNALKTMQPKEYQKIMELLDKTRKEREAEVESAVAEFSEIAEKEKKVVEVQGRTKSIYSIYKKMEQQNRAFENIFDLVGIRMICNSVKECYELLGVVHSEYRTVPNQFNDYIANPKKNGYRSIHTAVLWNNLPLEVQIRTWEMHYECETGLASHWQYKRYAKDKFFDKRLALAKQLVEWHKQARNAGNLGHSLKMGFEQNKIFVFTPKHKVVVLPEASTPIDFAFAIHSDLGRKCLKAKVNGKIVSLSHNLDNADIVEIITGKQLQVKRPWLSFVKSHKAQAKLRQLLGIKPAKGKPLIDRKEETLTSDKNIRIAKCCNPVPGDGIVGVRTTKRKVSVHRAECKNAARITKEKTVKIKWGLAEKNYVVGITVRAKDRPGLLPSILKIMDNSKVAIASTDAKVGKGNLMQCKFNVKIKNIEQLSGIMGKIRELPTVFETKRE